MKKFGILVKELTENRVQSYLKKSGSVFIVKYSGLSSPDITTLRLSLKEVSANMFVVKNAVARRALKSYGAEALVKAVEGPCGMVFVKDEPVEASKALFTFLKTHDKFKIEGGYLENRLLETKDVEALSKLPSKDVLRVKTVLALKSPLTKLVRVLNGNLSKLVICLDQIKQKKQ